MYSAFVGEAERCIRDVFRRARDNAPCMIILDEIDAIVTNRASASDGNNVQRRVSLFVLFVAMARYSGFNCRCCLLC